MTSYDKKLVRTFGGKKLAITSELGIASVCKQTMGHMS